VRSFALALVLTGCQTFAIPTVPDGAAAEPDLSAAADAGTSDGSETSDMSDDDAGSGCPGGFAGCDKIGFTDATQPNANRVITFQDYFYTPKCLQVRVGQTVIFRGDLVSHPLRQACGPVAALGPADDGTERSYVLGVAGTYDYYCFDHGNHVGQAMAGVLRVVP